MIVRMSVVAALLGISSIANQVWAEEEDAKFYGQINVSADIVRHQASDNRDYLLSSNASRLGIKGSEPLSDTVKALWKVEMGVDLTGETNQISPRNRYIGLINPTGMIVAGFHDTPYKSLGAKVDVMPNTIGDRRAVLGATNGFRLLDKRAANAVMYVSPVIAGLEVRLMRSSGQEQDDTTTSGTDENPLASYSAVYRGSAGFLGVAYEKDQKTEVDGVRFAAGIAIGESKVFTVYEKQSSSRIPEYDRSAYGLSAVYRLRDTSLKLQWMHADDNKFVSDSMASLYAAGITQHIGKEFELYMVAALIDNKSNSSYPLRGSSSAETPVDGEFYAAESLSSDVWGGSLGMLYRF